MFAPPVSAKPSIPARPEQLYVGDFANVLETSTVETIVRENEALFDRTGAEIVVVTVDFLDGESIEDYAATLFNEWGIGSVERNNGVLLLLAIGEDNYFATQGKGLEDSLSSGVLGDLLWEYLEPDFAAGDYDAGVRKTFAVFLDAVKKIYPSADDGAVVPGTPETPRYEGGYVEETPRRVYYFGNFFKTVVLFIVIFVVASVIGGGRRRRYRRRGGYYVPPPPPPPPWRGPMPRYRRPPPPPPPGGFFGGFGGPPHGGGSPGGRSSGGGFSHGGSSRSGGAGRSGGGAGRSSGGGFSHGGSTRGGGAGRR